MSFANPIYLWSLLGLVIPVAIHFLSRKEGKVIKLGSIRHVQETSTTQFRGIRLNEILLLLLRCAMVILFSLLLSGLHFNGRAGNWVLTESGTEARRDVQPLLDSLEDQGYEIHNLSTFATQASADSPLNYWSIIQQLENHNLEDVVIITFNRVGNFKGLQQAIPENIKIIPIEPEEKKFLIEAVQEGDSINLRSGVSNSNLTTFQTIKTRFVDDSIKVNPPRQVKITIVSESTRLREKQILMAAIRTIDLIVPLSFSVNEAEPTQLTSLVQADWLFWLREDAAPTTDAKILKWKPQTAQSLIRQSANKEWLLTQPLHEENALEKKLVVALAALLTYNQDLINVAMANDQRSLPEAIAWKRDDSKAQAAMSPLSQSSLVIVLFLLFFALERYLSFTKHQ